MTGRERTATGSPSWGIGAGLFALLIGCSERVDWDARAQVRPVGAAWGYAEIRVHGSRPRGADVGDACEGALNVVDKGTSRTLEIRTTGEMTVVTSTTPMGLVPAGSRLDEATLRAAAPVMSRAEAADVVRVLEGACWGPKIGYPATPTLAFSALESRYR